MISLDHKHDGEVSTKLREIEALRKSENVRTAKKMAQVSAILDNELRALQKLEREGAELVRNNITLEALDSILKSFDGGGDDAC